MQIFILRPSRVGYGLISASVDFENPLAFFAQKNCLLGNKITYQSQTIYWVAALSYKNQGLWSDMVVIAGPNKVDN